MEFHINACSVFVETILEVLIQLDGNFGCKTVVCGAENCTATEKL